MKKVQTNIAAVRNDHVIQIKGSSATLLTQTANHLTKMRGSVLFTEDIKSNVDVTYDAIGQQLSFACTIRFICQKSIPVHVSSHFFHSNENQNGTIDHAMTSLLFSSESPLNLDEEHRVLSELEASVKKQWEMETLFELNLTEFPDLVEARFPPPTLFFSHFSNRMVHIHILWSI